MCRMLICEGTNVKLGGLWRCTLGMDVSCFIQNTLVQEDKGMLTETISDTDTQHRPVADNIPQDEYTS